MSGLDAANIPDIVRVNAHDNEDNDVTAEDGARATIVPVADLEIDKTITDELVPGSTGTYGLAVTNNGPSAAAGVVVVDTLPAGLTAASAAGNGWQCAIGSDGRTITCARPALASGATSSITLVVDVAASVGGQEVTNVATVGGITTDKDPSNNRDTASATPPRVLGEVIEAPRALARTGAFLARWALDATALLLLGAALVLLSNARHQRTRP